MVNHCLMSGIWPTVSIMEIAGNNVKVGALSLSLSSSEVIANFNDQPVSASPFLKVFLTVAIGAFYLLSLFINWSFIVNFNLAKIILAKAWWNYLCKGYVNLISIL